MNATAEPWRQYICRACGLIYDEAEGDPDSGLAPGTRFEDIPDDWECPLCGVTKADFELFEKPEIAAAPQVAAFVREPGIVVVGAGLAGWSVVEAIREEDAAVPITLVSACNGDRYHKPELSVAMSRGLDTARLVRETADEAAHRLGVQLLHHTFAVGLTPALKQLRTTRGTLTYTHLVLAQGSRPVIPPELPESDCWRVNHLGAWQGLSNALGKARRHVAIVGAGMIGCELAEDLVRAGHNVTLIHRHALPPLSGLLPEIAASRLLHSLKVLGVDYRAATVAGLHTRADGRRHLAFDRGVALNCDEVVVATGLATEHRLAHQAGLAFERGLVVDPVTLQTSDPAIYALGDCISLDGEPCRFIEPIPHQARAIAHGVLALDSVTYAHRQPVLRLKTRSMPIVLHGMPSERGQWRTLTDNPEQLVMQQCVDDKPVAELRVDYPRASAA